MKYGVITLALVTALAAGVGLLSFRASSDPAVTAALDRHDAMAWLRADFQLTDEQFAAIKTLHESYSAVCDEHCRAIQEATQARNALKAAPQPDPAKLAAAERRVEELKRVCESAIATHVRQCAAHMSPEAGKRYLAMVLPRIENFDHQAAPDVAIGHRH